MPSVAVTEKTTKTSPQPLSKDLDKSGDAARKTTSAMPAPRAVDAADRMMPADTCADQARDSRSVGNVCMTRLRRPRSLMIATSEPAAIAALAMPICSAE